MTIVVHQVMNNLTCIFRYEIKDDTPIETKLEDKLIISETSTSLKASNKEEEEIILFRTELPTLPTPQRPTFKDFIF